MSTALTCELIQHLCVPRYRICAVPLPRYIENLFFICFLLSPSGGALRALMGAVMGEGPDVGGNPMFPTAPTQANQPPPPHKDSYAPPPHRDSATESSASNAGTSTQRNSASASMTSSAASERSDFATTSSTANEKKAVAVRLEAPPFIIHQDSLVSAKNI